ncbi:MAG TPA: PA-phosphatase [Mycobacterium sp.]|nr:PA-phosphatase [Mycobacterium sp.]
MVLLGLAVRCGSNSVDQWFQQGRHTALARLLFFTDYRTVLLVLAGALALALYRRRWLLAVLFTATPIVAVWLSRACKAWFGRPKEGALAYPSGHTTLMVTVLGMVLLVVGARLWVVAAAVVWTLLGMVGQAVTYHYFTDTVGALLLGTSLVCVAAAIVRSARRRRFTAASP